MVDRLLCLLACTNVRRSDVTIFAFGIIIFVRTVTLTVWITCCVGFTYLIHEADNFSYTIIIIILWLYAFLTIPALQHPGPSWNIIIVRKGGRIISISFCRENQIFIDFFGKMCVSCARETGFFPLKRALEEIITFVYLADQKYRVALFSYFLIV